MKKFAPVFALIAACALPTGEAPSSPTATPDVTTEGHVSTALERTAPLTPPANPAPKRFFVTSLAYNGNLMAAGRGTSGLDGADRLCATHAEAANMKGAWKAWLSTTSQNAIDRIDDVGPWYSTSGTKLFNNKANLATAPTVDLAHDENGFSLESTAFVWTATGIGGTLALASPEFDGTGDCNDWTLGSGGTAVAGRPDIGTVSPSMWTRTTNFACDQMLHLYCIEQ